MQKMFSFISAKKQDLMYKRSKLLYIFFIRLQGLPLYPHLNPSIIYLNIETLALFYFSNFKSHFMRKQKWYIHSVTILLQRFQFLT